MFFVLCFAFIVFGQNGVSKWTTYVTSYHGSTVGNTDGGYGFAQFGFDSGAGLAFDKNGNTYVSSITYGKIVKISPDGTASTIVTGLSGPSGLAVDDAGQLWITEWSANVIKVYKDGVVSNVIGSGTAGYNDGIGTAAQLNGPVHIVLDGKGFAYITEYQSHRIRKVDLRTFSTSTFAGSTSGVSGTADGVGSNARFSGPFAAVFDSKLNLFVADYSNYRIRKITPDGTVSTFAGNSTCGYADGQGAAALFCSPVSLTIGKDDCIYVADYINHIIRMVSPDGFVSTIAGIPKSAGAIDGVYGAAKLNFPAYITIDQDDNLYVVNGGSKIISKIYLRRNNLMPMASYLNGGGTGAVDGVLAKASFNFGASFLRFDPLGRLFIVERTNGRLRMMDNGVVTTVLAGLGSPVGVEFDNTGDIYVSDLASHRIVRISSTRQVTTLAGGAPSFADNAVGSFARFNNPTGIRFDGKNSLFIVDLSNHCIRRMNTTSPFAVTTFAGTCTSSGYANGNLPTAKFKSPHGLAIDSKGNLFIVDADNHAIRIITSFGQVRTFAGRAPSGGVGLAGFRDGIGAMALFNTPIDIAIDKFDNLYVTEAVNHRIRMILPDGFVTTIAGNGVAGTTTGFAPIKACLNTPYGIAVSPEGDVYSTQNGDNYIRKITLNHNIPRTSVGWVAGNGVGSDEGALSIAKFNFNWALSMDFDVEGNAYIPDQLNNKIRKITANGVVSTLISVNSPMDVKIDKNGILWVTVSSSSPTSFQVRRYTLSGVLLNSIGNGVKGCTDGTLSLATFSNPQGLCFDSKGNAFVADHMCHSIRRIDGQTFDVTTFVGGKSFPTPTYSFSAGSGGAIGSAGSYPGGGGAGGVVVSRINGFSGTVTPNQQSSAGGGANGGLGGSGGVGFGAGGGGGGLWIIVDWRPGGQGANGFVYIYGPNTELFLQSSTNFTITSSGTYLALLMGGGGGGGGGGSYDTSPPTAGGGAGYFQSGTLLGLREGDVLNINVGTGGGDRVTGGASWIKLPDGSTLTANGGINGGTNKKGGAGSSSGGRGATDASGACNGYSGGNSDPGSTGIGTSAFTSMMNFISTNTNIVSGILDGGRLNASISLPRTLAMDYSDTMFITDYYANVIRKITSSGVVTTILGRMGFPGSDDGRGHVAKFNNPGGIAIDNIGNLYIADHGSHLIRMISPDYNVYTIAGSTQGANNDIGPLSRFNGSHGLRYWNGTLYVLCKTSLMIQKITLERDWYISRQRTNSPSSLGSSMSPFSSIQQVIPYVNTGDRVVISNPSTLNGNPASQLNLNDYICNPSQLRAAVDMAPFRTTPLKSLRSNTSLVFFSRSRNREQNSLSVWSAMSYNTATTTSSMALIECECNDPDGCGNRQPSQKPIVNYCTQKLNGTCVCSLPTVNVTIDSLGYARGIENGVSCVIPKKTDFPIYQVVDATKRYCTHKLNGACVCIERNSKYSTVDANQYEWLYENGSPCIVPKPTDSPYQVELSTVGLNLYLDAKNPLSYPGTGLIFYDLSTSKNNFTLPSSALTWQSSGYFTVGYNGIAQGPNSDAFKISIEHTVIVVARSAAAGNALLYFYASAAAGSHRMMLVHLPWSDGIIHYDTLWCSGNQRRVSYTPSSPYVLKHYVFRTKTNSQQIFENNVLKASGTATLSSCAWGGGSYLWGGEGNIMSWQGDFYTMMIYNRSLTDDEITLNYVYMKERYNIPT